MDKQTLPLVSIIMPAHNAERFIAEAIVSVLQQTYTNWELLIIDDASTDGTAGVIQQFADPRIQYCLTSRIGSPSGVRNVGLRKAHGELIAFLDADDVYYPNTLEKLSQALLNNPDYSAVYGFATNMNELGELLPENDLLISNPSGEYAAPPDYDHSWKQIIMGQISCLLPALMLRKSTLERVGLFNEALCGPEDYEFYIRLFLDRHEGVRFLPDYVYYYRVYSSSLTKDPARYERLLHSCLQINTWLFTEADIPPGAYPLKSKAFAGCYRYYSRERLVHHQTDLCRRLAIACLRDPNVKFIDWLSACVPLIIRSYLPFWLDEILIAVRRNVRQCRYRWINRCEGQTISQNRGTDSHVALNT